MTEGSVLGPWWGEWGFALVFAAHLLSAGMALSVPWAAAHLEFWGIRRRRSGDREAAARLGAVGAVNSGVVLLIGLALLLFIAYRRTEPFFTAILLSAPTVLALAPFLAGHAALACAFCLGCPGADRRPLLRVAAAAGAGALALPAAFGFAVLSAAAADPALWPSLSGGGIFLSGAVLRRVLGVFLLGWAATGVSLMLIGSRAFRWSGGASLSEGARSVRAGSAVSLAAALLLLLLGAWSTWTAPTAVRSGMFGGDPVLTVLSALTAAGAVGLAEALLIVLRRRGSAPYACVAAAVLLVLATFAFASLRVFSLRAEVRARASAAAPLQAGREQEARAAPPANTPLR